MSPKVPGTPTALPFRPRSDQPWRLRRSALRDPRALRQRLCCVDRIGLAVSGQMHRAERSLGVEKRPELEARSALTTSTSDEGAAPWTHPAATPPCGRRSWRPERTDLPKAGRWPVSFQASRKARSYIAHRQMAGGAELANQARGVPRRPASRAEAMSAP